MGKFLGSSTYWENRYASGETSGKGSYGALAQYKADFINAFVEQNKVESVLDLGAGDGNQLSVAKYPRYIGVDISRTALSKCQTMFKDDASKTFVHFDDFGSIHAELTLSLDVIFHLIEDVVFDIYMQRLFTHSSRFVLIYSSDKEAYNERTPHVRHRKFTDWINCNVHTFAFVSMIPHPVDIAARKTMNTVNQTPSRFHVYAKVGETTVLPDV